MAIEISLDDLKYMLKLTQLAMKQREGYQAVNNLLLGGASLLLGKYSESDDKVSVIKKEFMKLAAEMFDSAVEEWLNAPQNPRNPANAEEVNMNVWLMES